MFLWSLIEELCTKEENDKTSWNINFGHECTLFCLSLFKDLFFTLNFAYFLKIKNRMNLSTVRCIINAGKFQKKKTSKKILFRVH